MVKSAGVRHPEQMTSPWRPEREVSCEEAAEAVRGLGLAADHVALVATGWDNTVVSVDHEWLFRFPRRSRALPGVERELVHLPRLAPQLPLPVPVPEHTGTTGQPPWTFWGARALPGTELAASPHADTGHVAATTGAFLKALHAVPVDPDLPVDPNRRGDTHERAARATGLLDDLRRAGLVGDLPAVHALLDQAPDHPAEGAHVTSHGDLHGRHVLVDDVGRVSGIIDWGDLCAAPAAVDLSFVWSALRPEDRPAFWRAYGPLDDETRLRASILAVSLLAMLATYAHDTRLDALLRTCLRHLDSIGD